jgi:hypothetical protein
MPNDYLTFKDTDIETSHPSRLYMRYIHKVRDQHTTRHEELREPQPTSHRSSLAYL